MDAAKIRNEIKDGFRNLPLEERAKIINELAKANRQWPSYLVEMDVPLGDGKRFKAMRSDDFLVQFFDEGKGIVRLSINRTYVDMNGEWLANISWDELQSLKAQAGYGDKVAVEVFPSDDSIVNVSNMRHLWVFAGGQDAINVDSFVWKGAGNGRDGGN